jgi:hypothetical protein
MEQSVRNIYVISGRGEEAHQSYKPALCFRGRKHVHCIINDETRVRVVTLDIRDYDRASLVPFHGAEYPIERFKRSMLAVGARKGITARAALLLRLPNDAEEPETLPPDEALDPGPTAMPAPEPAKNRRTLTVPPLDPAKAAKAVGAAADRGTLVARIAAELKITPQQLRVKLRAAGLRAPYLDESALRGALK